mmetsp:Transcript_14737/g.46263  ORF Transcript_14737/g.46263 Transcript_14737/m.46263 type:complete len:422 (+) Transcript_14737:226-1491(+)
MLDGSSSAARSLDALPASTFRSAVSPDLMPASRDANEASSRPIWLPDEVVVAAAAAAGAGGGTVMVGGGGGAGAAGGGGAGAAGGGAGMEGGTSCIAVAEGAAGVASVTADASSADRSSSTTRACSPATSASRLDKSSSALRRSSRSFASSWLMSSLPDAVAELASASRRRARSRSNACLTDASSASSCLMRPAHSLICDARSSCSVFALRMVEVRASWVCSWMPSCALCCRRTAHVRQSSHTLSDDGSLILVVPGRFSQSSHCCVAPALPAFSSKDDINCGLDNSVRSTSRPSSPVSPSTPRRSSSDSSPSKIARSSGGRFVATNLPPSNPACETCFTSVGPLLIPASSAVPPPGEEVVAPASARREDEDDVDRRIVLRMPEKRRLLDDLFLPSRAGEDGAEPGVVKVEGEAGVASAAAR